MNQASTMKYPPSANGQTAHGTPQGEAHQWEDTDEEFMQLVHELQAETIDTSTADSCCAIGSSDDAPGRF